VNVREACNKQGIPPYNAILMHPGSGSEGSPRARLLVIGLDSADRRLVEQWCDSGDLPNLRAMRDSGVSGALSTPPGLGDDAVWASFYTGVLPGVHGRYFWQRVGPGSYETPQFADADMLSEPFWSGLSRSGKKVAVFDVPKCPLSTGLNGIQIADWQVHGRDHDQTCSWPPALASSLLERFGDDMTDRTGDGWLCRMHSLPEQEQRVLLRHLLEGIARKTRAASEFLAEGDWDLFLVVFKEAHCAGHQFWQLPEQPGTAGASALKQVYKALDRSVGELTAANGQGGSTIVFSDLGMGPNYTGEHLLDEILQRLESGWLSRRRNPHRLQRILSAIMRSLRRNRPDGESRLAYQLEHNEMSGAIRINLGGREPSGKIRPGAGYREFCEFLTRELLDIRHLGTNQRVVDAVLSSDELFEGEQRGRLPDLLAVWSRSGPITAITSPTIGVLERDDPRYRTGNHVSGGFYFGSGSGVRPGRQPEPSSIIDLAPTIARILDVRLPYGSGVPIEALCAANGNRSRLGAARFSLGQPPPS
jgi:predicted AlkP superfamily phosphohydrolase/phosphomutase